MTSRVLLLASAALAAVGCGSGGSSGWDGPGGVDGSQQEDAGPVEIEYHLGGVAQKGPLVLGSSVAVSELNGQLDPTGRTFDTTTVDELGHFALTVQLGGGRVDVSVAGYYFDEVRGQLSEGTLTLRGLSSLGNGPDANVNVNVLTHLARDRVRTLAGQGATLAEALDQSRHEVLAVFHFDIAAVGDALFDQLDFTNTTDGDAMLVAASAVLQQAAVTRAGTGPVTAELSHLLALVAADLAPDGTLDDFDLVQQLRQAGMQVDAEAVRTRLETYYADQGTAIVVPPFETYLDRDGDGVVPDVPPPPDDAVWTVVGTVPQAHTIWASAVVDGKLYLLAEEGGNCGATQNGTEVYDPATGGVTAKAPGPGGCGCDRIAGAVGQVIYLVGPGCSWGTQAYHTTADTWTAKAAPPTSRMETRGAALGGKVYVVGGRTRTSDMSPLDTVEVYDPATNSWNTAAPLPTPRAPAAVAVVDGLLYVIGSWYAEEGLCSIVEAYDPTTDTWQSRAAYPDCAVSGKVDHTVASGVVGGTIVVMRDNAAADTDPPWCYRAYRYDPVANVWMGPSYSGDIEASILSGFGVINDVLYIVSGYNSGASGMLDRVVTYSLTPAQ